MAGGGDAAASVKVHVSNSIDLGPGILPAIVVIDLDELEDTALPAASPSERAAADKRYPPGARGEAKGEAKGEARRLMLRRRQAVRGLLASCTGCPSGGIACVTLPSGQPVIEPAALGLHVSLARRGGLTAIALASAPIGVDLEPDRIVDPLPLDLLTHEERDHVSGEAGPRMSRAFLEIWTRREARMKALGAGFDVSPADLLALANTDRVADGYRLVAGPDARPVHLAWAVANR